MVRRFIMANRRTCQIPTVSNPVIRLARFRGRHRLSPATRQWRNRFTGHAPRTRHTLQPRRIRQRPDLLPVVWISAGGRLRSAVEWLSRAAARLSGPLSSGFAFRSNWSFAGCLSGTVSLCGPFAFRLSALQSLPAGAAVFGTAGHALCCTGRTRPNRSLCSAAHERGRNSIVDPSD